jgi:hypothetical protein
MAVASKAPAVGPTPADQQRKGVICVPLAVDPVLGVEALDTRGPKGSCGALRQLVSQHRGGDTHLTAPPVYGTENNMTTASTAPNMSGAMGVSRLFSASQYLSWRASGATHRQRA